MLPVRLAHHSCLYHLSLARQARLKANLNYLQRFLLAEIIKTSKVSIDTLLGIIREEQIQPIWDEILLPPGKSFRT